jgi:hypothetical protein
MTDINLAPLSLAFQRSAPIKNDQNVIFGWAGIEVMKIPL